MKDRGNSWRSRTRLTDDRASIVAKAAKLIDAKFSGLSLQLGEGAGRCCVVC